MSIAAKRATALAEERALFTRYRRDRDPELRDRLVERSLPLARHLAARYDAPAHSYDDVFQVACVALVKAVDRFDPGRGVAFSSYAVPTMIGEIKRYFRDQTWAVHVTRELQERTLRVSRAVSDTARRLGRQPTVAEIAAAAGITEDETLEALRAATAYRAASLDAPPHEGGELVLAETIGREDDLLATAAERAHVSELVERLGAREQVLLRLRFERDLTQSEIADVMGMSQLHVARVLRSALERLRRLDEPVHARGGVTASPGRHPALRTSA
jgi:RNA polymerase sigma-B factor